ncbi:MAG: Na-K-Cl cotransporter [Gemmatimonadota bacterium]|nr:MAG: Na-K-Cl cotransporter [Gemmatimonadota bacterium]
MAQDQPNPPAPEREEVVSGRPGGLGTFGGVFTPSLLTILGVIMYLRFGWVVGNVGLAGTMVIVALATSITFLTGLSIAAIATDQRVRTGGAYYMISRSLGIEVGGAIGIPLFLAQGLSVALYTVGFAESLAATFPVLNERMVGLAVTVLVAIVALTSARFAIRAQYVIMAAIGLSLLSLLAGSPLEGVASGVPPQPITNPENFWVVFAVFFPAVTGIMAGVNLSGDLEDPSRSIPRGTFAAVGVGLVVYLILPVILATRVDPQTLVDDPLIMTRISVWGNAILLGVWGATLSSAVGSVMGAPRVLQALARDQVLPRWLRWLGKGSKADDTPRAGTILTLGIALVAVYFGSLNLIAPILTMFFLTTYGVLNVAAGLERFLGSPSFRPTFPVHWIFSLLGAVGCVAVMFLINALATIAAIVFVISILFWLERRGLEATWGDVRRGVWMALMRAGLLRLRDEPDPRNWRPHLLVLSGAPTRRWHLIDLANSLSHSRGLVTVSTVLGEGDITRDRIQAMEANIREYMAKRGVQALVRVISAPDPFVGAIRLVDAYGLGAFYPNTVLLGHSEETTHRDDFCQMVTRFHESQRNVMIVRRHGHEPFGGRRLIDLWWGGLRGNGSLMMILGYLLSTSLHWKDARVRLKMVVPTQQAANEAETNLKVIIEQTRTLATPHVLVSDGRPFDQILRASSQDADLIFMGMAAPGSDFRHYYESLLSRAEGLPTTVFVLASEELAFNEVLLRDGR